MLTRMCVGTYVGIRVCSCVCMWGTCVWVRVCVCVALRHGSSSSRELRETSDDDDTRSRPLLESGSAQGRHRPRNEEDVGRKTEDALVSVDVWSTGSDL